MNARTLADGSDASPARTHATDVAPADRYGTLIERATLRVQRVLPGPIDRVWSYLADGELRRRWLASGTMEPKAGSTFELVWRNDELTTPPGRRPDGFGATHSMQSRIVEFDPPRRLAFTWGEGTVTFELEPQGARVLLTLTHTRLDDHGTKLKVGAGWHAHLDVLDARLTGVEPAPFWDHWAALKRDYERRVPA